MRAPSEDGKDPGEVISGWYDIQNGQAVVWDRSGGAPIGRATYNPGDDPKVIARRLLREKRSPPSGFYGRGQADVLDLRLVQLKGGSAGVSGAEIARLKKACTTVTVNWLIAAFDGETLHLVPEMRKG